MQFSNPDLYEKRSLKRTKTELKTSQEITILTLNGMTIGVIRTDDADNRLPVTSSSRKDASRDNTILNLNEMTNQSNMD